MKIDLFVDLVTNSRRRTGIVLLNPERIDFLSDFESAGVEIIDLSQNFSGQVIISDDAFLEIVSAKAIGKVTAFINVELYLAPRYEEAHYLKYLMPKLLNSEPLKPIFLIFYSKRMYDKFKSYYVNYRDVDNHFFEEDF